MLFWDVDPALLPAAMPLFLRSENSVSQFVAAISAGAMGNDAIENEIHPACGLILDISVSSRSSVEAGPMIAALVTGYYINVLSP